MYSSNITSSVLIRNKLNQFNLRIYANNPLCIELSTWFKRNNYNL